MPEEILIITLFAIAAGTLISVLKIFMGFRERKRTVGGHRDSSMTTSELERMMRRAVTEASKPMMDKIEDLEFELSTWNKPRKLEEASTDLLMDIDEIEEEAAPVRRKTRRERS